MTRAQTSLVFLFVILIALIPVSAVSVPRGVAFIPGITGLLLLVFYPLAFKERPKISKPALLTALVISGFALASTAWSIDPHAAFQMALRAVAVLFGSTLLLCAVRTLKIKNMKPALWILPVSLFIASVLIVIELKSGAPFYRLVRNEAPGTFVNPSEFNRAAVIIALLFFPAMSILAHFIGWRKAFALAFITAGPMLLLTDSQSTQLAFLLGMLTFALFPYRQKAAWLLLAGGISALMLAAPFLCVWVFDHLAHDIDSAPMMGNGGAYAGARLEIWDYLSRYLLQNPLYGFGFEATRLVKHFDSKEVFQAGTTILHPHNFVIQIWMEFGLLGIIPAAAAITGLILTIRKKLPVSQARIILPLLISTLLIASTTYGIWQGWWIGALFTTAAVSLIALRLAASEHREGLNHGKTD